MPKKPSPSTINQTAIGDGNVQVAGDNNTVNIIQKFFNIFKSDAETVDQRNRRIMLGHVENFWVKGILEKSLHGAALLELGIKEDPDALSYPWAIKRDANKETLTAGTSVLEIFQEIGMERSLLILGAPGSGKTTMLLELTRQLIERARVDVTEPIPVVFNLSSWTKELTLADWLARELNNIYTIPKKVALTWVKENKMLLLLDGLDEVQQESRDKCVDAINEFRKKNGLTNMAVCSRIEDYTELKRRLSFNGAIEIQPLTLTQVNNYLNGLGTKMLAIKKVIKKDAVLLEMAETPLFLSIMILAYQGNSAEALKAGILDNIETRRKNLFDAYIQRMFEREARAKKQRYSADETKSWLVWLAQKKAGNYLFSRFINRLPENTRKTLLENSQLSILRLEDIDFSWLKRHLLWQIFYLTILGSLILLTAKLISLVNVWLACAYVLFVFQNESKFKIVRNYTARIILYLAGFNRPFLNHCVDLIFLRRVGGGYIFVHRLLMEHFADMYPADEK